MVTGASMSVIKARSWKDTKGFKVDHAFAFAIIKERNNGNIPIVVGMINSPTEA